jgi:uncharacterized protein (DUF488 family)
MAARAARRWTKSHRLTRKVRSADGQMVGTGQRIRPFFTIGHSTRPDGEFVALLREAGADCVVDVRKMPRSRTNPQYNEDLLPSRLARDGIEYRHVAPLGGLRKRGRSGNGSPNTFWENASFRNYADYALTPAFRAGYDGLLALGARHTCALMCAEAVWWRCHRRIIADYLLADGFDVFHIMGPGKIERAACNAAARRDPASGGLVYAARGQR